jgi:hypothetical protein
MHIARRKSSSSQKTLWKKIRPTKVARFCFKRLEIFDGDGIKE